MCKDCSRCKGLKIVHEVILYVVKSVFSREGEDIEKIKYIFMNHETYIKYVKQLNDNATLEIPGNTGYRPGSRSKFNKILDKNIYSHQSLMNLLKAKKRIKCSLHGN